MATNIQAGFKLLNDDLLDSRNYQSDFFGDNLADPSTRNELTKNSKTLQIGIRFFDNTRKKSYVISGKSGSGDDEVWIVEYIGSGTVLENQSVLSKFSENGGKLLFDGNEVQLNSSSDIFTYDAGVSIFNLNHSNWALLSNGTHILNGMGDDFVYTPFQRTANKKYTLAIQHYKYGYGLIDIMTVYTDATEKYVNKSMYIRTDLSSQWLKIIDHEQLTEYLNELGSSSHYHKRRVSNIEELFYTENDPNYGIPLIERVKGIVVLVDHYDESNYSSTTAKSRAMMFHGESWYDLGYWSEVPLGNINPQGDVKVLIPNAGNLTVPMAESRIMHATITESTTIAFSDIADQIGCTRRLIITRTDTAHVITWPASVNIISDVSETELELKVLLEVVNDGSNGIGASERVDMYGDSDFPISSTPSEVDDAVDKKHEHADLTKLEKYSEDGSGNPTHDGNELAKQSAIDSVYHIGESVTLTSSAGVLTVPFNQPKIMKCSLTTNTTVTFSNMANMEGMILYLEVTGLDTYTFTLPSECVIVGGSQLNDKCVFMFHLTNDTSGNEEIKTTINNE